MEETQKIELLAPAQNFVLGKAAIQQGADAVYIGAELFGARSQAGNPIQEIAQLVHYAHLYHARVYLTLNTLLFDHEIALAQNLAHQAYEAGVDAFIIQDMGLLEAGLPPLPLFASTQTHNFSLERIQFLEKVGFTRVILARELTLSEIQHIRHHTDTLELETFVHGALCTAFSGQCYLSAATTERSGNRGNCSQRCRLKYKLLDGGGKELIHSKHLLSLKDLNLSEHLADLMEAGVRSFKIEGRLKGVDYIKNVVADYRKRLDDLLTHQFPFKKTSSGSIQRNFIPQISESFNRGFSTYFLQGRKRELGSWDSPKSMGTPVGKVLRLQSHYFVLDQPHDLIPGDGISFFSAGGELEGAYVNQVEGNRIFPSSMEGIILHAEIRRNLNKAFIKSMEQDDIQRRICLSITIRDSAHGVSLCAHDEDGIETLVEFPVEKTAAHQKERAIQQIRQQLSKAGNSIFSIENIDIQMDIIPFLPLSQLNQFRRELLSAHEESRLKKAQPIRCEYVPNSYPFPATAVDYRLNIINQFAVDFYQRHGVQQIEMGYERQKSSSDAIIFSSRYCLKFELGVCPKKHGQASQSPEPWLLDDGKFQFPLSFDCEACIMHLHEPLK